MVGFTGAADDISTVRSADEGPMAIQEFECIPLDRVVRSRQDDAPIGAFPDHRHLHRGGRGQVQVDDVDAHSHQRTGHEPLHHVAGRACIPPYDHLRAVLGICRAGVKDPTSVALCGTHDIRWGQVLLLRTPDGPAKS